MDLQARVQAGVEKLLPGGWHSGAAMAWGPLDGGELSTAAAGDIDPDTPFFAASATKLVTTALVKLLQEEGRLRLDQPFREVLPGPETAALHLRAGRDRTEEITVSMLLRHCSGLPDYFQSENRRTGLMAELAQGKDRALDFGAAMDIARRLGPVAEPGDLRRARYSDTNFQLLGRAIEVLEGAPYAEVARRRIFAPLGLRQTWIYSDPADSRPRALSGRQAISIPRAMAFAQADGGMVTTAREGVTLLRGLFGGGVPGLAPGWWLPLCDWRPMFFPLSYGTGLMRFSLPRLMTGLRRMPEMVGHSGLSGTVMFHAPATGLVVAGTVNQLARRSTAFRLMAQVALGHPGA